MNTPLKKQMRSPYAGSRLEKSISVLENVTRMVPIAHKKALTQAMYTTGTMATLFIFGVISFYCYDVLKVFIKPLLWALLCGSVLFPLKQKLHQDTEKKLKDFQKENKLMILEVILLPFYMFSWISDLIGSTFLNHFKMILMSFFLCGSVKFLLYFELISNFFSLVWSCSELFLMCLHFLDAIVSKQSYILTITVGLIIALAITKSVYLKQPMVISVWGCFLSFVFNTYPGIKFPTIIVTFALFILGLFSSKPENLNATPDHSSDFAAINPFQWLINYVSSKNKYFKLLSFLYVFITVIQDSTYYLLFILPPLLLYFLKIGLLHEATLYYINSGLNKALGMSSGTLKDKLCATLDYFKSNLMPPFAVWFYSKIKNGDRRLNKLVVTCLPSISSAVIILMLFVITVFSFMFLFVKIQHEGVYAVQLTSEVIEKSASWHPELKNLLPSDPVIPKTVSSFVGTGFTKVREYISSSLNSTVDEKTLREVLDVWDNLYFDYNQYFVASKPKNFFNERYTETDSKETIESLLKKLYDIKEIKKWVFDNLSYLLSLANSSVIVAQKNVTLITSLLLTALNTLFQGGYYVVNFFVYFLVFVTTLFYLLSTSDDQYILNKIISSTLNPVTKPFEISDFLEKSISGVFGASIKMFCFYGLFTWVNHSLFGSGIIYIPSILAATFSVIPLVKVYWFCVPSFLELWLLNGSLARGVGLLAFQVLPTLVVDTSIYSEIENSCHPYLTVLAVAGGVYRYGLEGAIFGPIILCFLLVAGDLFSQVMQSFIAEADTDNEMVEDAFES